ncbi:hypothetical protein OHB39_06250 [Streptomyces sp. NBC_00047]|uniref:hypothetical protein n=1 Tax=Streptomyces sp. NBC_00047 TaxID=2975627 RepID=UPI0022513B19|nr:hypothetical protein [Streptomyces sp. NBC_00047]MCX5607184.1 hypothetical protein [Streptomyces sp. NBC_00047]
MSTPPEAITKGISDAWDFWLSQHDISTPELIQDAVEKSVSSWLTAHSDELIAAIATAVARNAKEEP